jgi:hypothetical protein
MILADQREQGTLDPDCITLAELHSSAVDFSKTGRAVELSRLPRVSRWRPDFLAPGPSITIHDKSAIDLDTCVASHDNDEEDDGEDGPAHKFYASEKILGELFEQLMSKTSGMTLGSQSREAGRPFGTSYLWL